jgi:hypothetical protein
MIAWGGRRAKYGNRKTTVDGQVFDSKREAQRWQDLQLMQKAGEIYDLKRQVRYKLDVNGVHICDYIADFVYLVAIDNEQPVVEDAKGVRTREYRLKKRLMEAVHGIMIAEV